MDWAIALHETVYKTMTMRPDIDRPLDGGFRANAFEPVLLEEPGSSLPVQMQLWLKRAIDLSLGGMALILSLPVWIVITVSIKTTSKGPIFFRQKRVGKDGVPFEIYKFRTMVHHAAAEDHKAYIKQLLKDGDPTEEERARLMAAYIEYVHGKVTQVGRFLRASSLDELPQLINIVKGEMSLVGPRPHPTYEVKEYKDWYHRRHTVKTGLTGWSKINLRLTPQNYEEAIQYDLWYVDHWSLALDIKIIIKTIPFILFNRDAR